MLLGADAVHVDRRGKVRLYGCRVLDLAEEGHRLAVGGERGEVDGRRRAVGPPCARRRKRVELPGVEFGAVAVEPRVVRVAVVFPFDIAFDFVEAVRLLDAHLVGESVGRVSREHALRRLGARRVVAGLVAAVDDDAGCAQLPVAPRRLAVLDEVVLLPVGRMRILPHVLQIGCHRHRAGPGRQRLRRHPAGRRAKVRAEVLRVAVVRASAHQAPVADAVAEPRGIGVEIGEVADHVRRLVAERVDRRRRRDGRDLVVVEVVRL